MYKVYGVCYVEGAEVMLMVSVLNSTDVRQNWGAFIDDVVRGRPAVVKRNRDHFAALSVDHMNLLLEPYTFTINFLHEDDGSVTGSLEEIDLVANAPDIEQLKKALAEELVEYAREYMDNIALYYYSPNRRRHLPYVLRVLIQPDAEAVAALLSA